MMGIFDCKFIHFVFKIRYYLLYFLVGDLILYWFYLSLYLIRCQREATQKALTMIFSLSVVRILTLICSWKVVNFFTQVRKTVKLISTSVVTQHVVNSIIHTLPFTITAKNHMVESSQKIQFTMERILRVLLKIVADHELKRMKLKTKVRFSPWSVKMN